MQEKTKEPEIRFAGFTGAWEQREVNQLLVERNTQAPKSSEYPLMAFIANEGIAPKGDRYDRSSLVKDEINKLYKRTERGDFIYSSNNLETGSIGLNDYGKASISPVYSIFSTTENSDSDFIGHRLVRKDFIKEMVKWRQGVIYGQWRIHESDFLRISISVPSVPEQQKIGRFLRQIDSLLTLHQRKYEKLLNIKKSMLEKMFPKEGEVVPEIRFKGFTGAWEQRKFGEMANRRSEVSASGNLPRVEYEDIVSGTGTLNKDVFEKQSQKQGIVFHSGDVLYGKLRPYLQNWLLASFNGLAVGDFWVLEPQGLNSNYLYRIIQTKQFDEIANQSVGTKMPRADWKLVSKATFLNPASFNEQRLIGKFFKDIDSLLTLHQRKLEMLKNVKQAFLEKMFV